MEIPGISVVAGQVPSVSADNAASVLVVKKLWMYSDS
jgi:hypothetical protein